MTDTLPERTPMLIGGSEHEAADGRWFPIYESATGAVLSQVPRGGNADIAAATDAALGAAAEWRTMAAAERGRALARIADDLEQQLEPIARLLTRETGNAIRRQSRPEVQSAVDLLRYFAGGAAEVKGETVPLGPGLLNFTTREPLGVVGAMTPWNAPVQLAVVKCAAALATGNTVVLKVSEEAPLAVLAVARLAQQHLPLGALNVVTGFGDEAGAALLTEPRIAKLSFTGSTTIGRLVMGKAAERIVPVSLELGGKGPSIVFPDADDDLTVNGVVDSMRFPRQGQSCTAGSRLLVHASIADSFTAKVAAQVEQLVIGDPLDERTDIGSIINERQFDRVDSFVRDTRERGGRVLTGGARSAGASSGFFYTPTVLADVNPTWPAATDEIFGPVLSAMTWTDEDEAVRMANASSYGLAAYVWSHDIDTALRTADRIEAGWVQVNRGLGQLPGMSYGGIKESGMGREFSIEGAIDGFTSRKTTTVGIRS
ncbi:aldehyde dehydrogenase family protein [Flexivirga meconopsidis]|uniref:aldehyde dehydrogenase family protein n=1 Tax=Flexivirga meconopsidis TaxID=2977121 RepID=UPI00223FEDA2|nr:aldehyde dehydrogenase family protein [Flexivirga meconopsidis]